MNAKKFLKQHGIGPGTNITTLSVEELLDGYLKYNSATNETKKPENPPAFPFTWVSNDGTCAESGMTLRDYFAAQVLPTVYNNSNGPEHIAQLCYKMADAILKERSKQP